MLSCVVYWDFGIIIVYHEQVNWLIILTIWLNFVISLKLTQAVKLESKVYSLKYTVDNLGAGEKMKYILGSFINIVSIIISIWLREQ